jgi:hypothetical protein
MYLTLVLTTFQHHRFETCGLAAFLKSRTKVRKSVFEERKSTSVHIRIASSLKVAAGTDEISPSQVLNFWSGKLCYVPHQTDQFQLSE